MSTTKQLYIDRIKEICKNKNGELIDFDNFTYINVHSKFNIKCNYCTNIWESSYKKLLWAGNWCTTCAKDNTSNERIFKIVVEYLMKDILLFLIIDLTF
jgi:hypothetical protein